MVGLTAAALWLLFGWTEQNMFYAMAHAVGWSFNLLGSDAPLWARWALLAFVWLSSPFLEEAIFRGFAQSRFTAWLGARRAEIIIAVTFALFRPCANSGVYRLCGTNIAEPMSAIPGRF